MAAAIRAHLVKIGNSRGVRIPKTVIEQLHLDDEVELFVQGDQLIIRRLADPRAGWEDAFRTMAEHGDDALIDMGDDVPSEWDEREWQW